MRAGTKAALRLAALLAALVLLGGVAVVGGGLFNVSAQVGHLPGVSWVLHTTFRNAVRLRAMPLEAVPDLSDPALVALGARHYASACAPCHATPGAARTATMRAMVPEPPQIEQALRGWSANHLHWIVFNGVKMTGMPAWPAAGRPDEVWPVVAYLEAVKRGMSTGQQQELTAPVTRKSPATGQGPAGVAYCNGCHEAYCNGCHEGIARHVPRLDIQGEAYLAAALQDYASGARRSGIMEQALSGVSADETVALAAHFASQAARRAAPEPGPHAAAGGALARRGSDDVPACTACHGPGATRARADYPALAGQDRAYLAAQLRLWRDGVRGGSDIMTAAARHLSDAEIASLADWYAAQPPRRGPAAD